MTLIESPVRGRVDADGRLVQADEALAALQERAGGAVGGPVVLPQLAAFARLVRRIGAPVARAVLAADGDEDLDLWVRGRPDGDAVLLAIAGWGRRTPATWRIADAAAAPAWDLLRAEGDWTFETDAALRVVALSADGAAALGGAAGLAPGDALTRLVALEDGGDGGPPLLAALADGRAFDDQIATARVGGARFRLAGVPRFDPAGRLAGFRGAAFAADAPPAPVPDPAPEGEGAFAVRLDAALRDPLRRIVAAAEAIRGQEDGPLRSDYGGYAGDIATAGRHLLGLVGDLVDLDAVERADLEVDAVPLDLVDLARRAAGLLAVRADDKGVRIARPDEEAAAVPARGDFGRALQVLVNLIGNAVRFGPEGSAVTVTVEDRGASVAAVVADEGRGIAPEDRARAFEKFERLGATEPGSGLGLYISRRLARAMGGDVTIESGAGEGARVVLTLPRGTAAQ